jgi:hypothetical protein
MSADNRSREFGKFSLNIHPSHSSVLFLVLASYQKILPPLKAMYPGGQLYEQIEDGQFVFAVYYYQKPDE